MRRMIILAVAVATSLPVEPAGAQQQSIRVALEFTDSTGVVRSAFASALRSLSDIEVVGANEEHDLIMRAVSICSEQCGSHQIAFRLSEPPMKWFIERQEDWIKNYTAALEYPIQMWVLSWGRSRYEQAARDLVREIDTKCFERIRIERRATRLLLDGDSAGYARARAPLHNPPFNELLCG